MITALGEPPRANLRAPACNGGERGKCAQAHNRCGQARASPKRAWQCVQWSCGGKRHRLNDGRGRASHVGSSMHPKSVHTQARSPRQDARMCTHSPTPGTYSLGTTRPIYTYIRLGKHGRGCPRWQGEWAHTSSRARMSLPTRTYNIYGRGMNLLS